MIIDKIKEMIEGALTPKEENGRFKIYLDNDTNIDPEIVKEFTIFCLDELNIEDDFVRIVLTNERESFTTFAYYDIEKKIACIYCKDRALLDIFRSLAHELVHHKQNVKGELTDEVKNGDNENNDGADIENEANSVAGVIMRKFGRTHSELY